VALQRKKPAAIGLKAPKVTRRGNDWTKRFKKIAS